MDKVKWTDEKVLSVIDEARLAGAVSARAKLVELIQAGAKWSITDQNDKEIGRMLDVCGFAHLSIKAVGSFYLIAKHLSVKRTMRFTCDLAHGGGGWLSIYDSTNRQEMSVNKAACKGQAEVLRKYGLSPIVKVQID